MALSGKDFSTDPHGWAELLPERKSVPPLTGNHEAQWAVIGAGVTGLACARRLAELNPDQDIILLDARLVGQGASGRNSGYAVTTSHFAGGYKVSEAENYRRVNRINRAGLGILRKQVKELSIDCQWHEGGFFHAAADKKAMAEHGRFLRYLNELQIEHTPLEREALREKLGTGMYQAGVHVPDGALMQPAAMVRGLADALPTNVKLYEQNPVLSIQHGDPLILKLACGEIRTQKLILATNYESGKLGFLKRYMLGSTLSGSFTRVLTDEELASLGTLSEWGVLSLHTGGATVRLTVDKRICIRNTAEYNCDALLSADKLSERQTLHRDGFERRFPKLAHVPFEYAWSGVEGISSNGTNFFGRQRENIYLAGGYNGSGVSRGTAFGTAIADHSCGWQSDLINDCLASAPGSWLPPRPILDIGAFFTVRARFQGIGQDR